MVAIPVGAFANPDFPKTRRSIFERRKHDWVDITGVGIEHHPADSVTSNSNR
jgi:hypothetical protein